MWAASLLAALGEAGADAAAEVVLVDDWESVVAFEQPLINRADAAIAASAQGAGGGSVVEWRGAFYRGYPNNDPPPELSDEAAIAAVTGVYQAGLDALVEKFGAPGS